MSFHCNGTMLFQGNLPRVLPVTIFKYASSLIPYIILFLILRGEWPSLVFKVDIKKAAQCIGPGGERKKLLNIK